MLKNQGLSTPLCIATWKNQDCHEQETIQILRNTTTEGEVLNINAVSYCITAWRNVTTRTWKFSKPDWTKPWVTWSDLLADLTLSRRFVKRSSRVPSNLNDPMILKLPTCSTKHRFKNWAIWSRWTHSGAKHIIPIHLLQIVLEIIQLLIIIGASQSACSLCD